MDGERIDEEREAQLDRAEALLDGVETDSAGNALTPERRDAVEAIGGKVIETLKSIYDPEIPVDIYELGLIYRIDVEDDDSVKVVMTLTSPHCPVAETLPLEVEQRVAMIEAVEGCEVVITWEPPWSPQMMSEEAQLELGMIY